MTLCLPDDLYERLKRLGASRDVSLNKLMEEAGTAAIAAHDAEIRFNAAVSGADRRRALGLLDRLDTLEAVKASDRKPPSGRPN